MEKLEVGDFARNTIHGFVVFLLDTNVAHFDFYAITMGIPNESEVKSYWGQIGFSRLELCSELEKVQPTEQLISQAKDILNNLNSEKDQQLDNLSYIELLYKLNEMEKALK